MSQSFPPTNAENPAYLSQKVETVGIEPTQESPRASSQNCPTCRTFAEENEKQAHEIAKLNREILEQVRSKQALKGQLTRVRNEDDLNEDVAMILELWLELCVTPRGRANTNIALDSDRAEITRVALKRRTKGTPDERRLWCMDAVQGVALRPYEAYGKRYGAPAEGRTKRCDIVHALGTDQRIEENAGYYRRVHERESKWLEMVEQQAFIVYCHWGALAAEARMREAVLAAGQLTVEVVRPQLELVVDNTDREAA